MAATFTDNQAGITYKITDPFYSVTTVIASLSFVSLFPIGVVMAISFLLAAFSVIGVGWGVGFFLIGVAAFVLGITATVITFKRGFSLITAGAARVQR